jgi:hypothetical protein
MFQLEHLAHAFPQKHSLDSCGAAPVHDPGFSIVTPSMG